MPAQFKLCPACEQPLDHGFTTCDMATGFTFHSDCYSDVMKRTPRVPPGTNPFTLSDLFLGIVIVRNCNGLG